MLWLGWWRVAATLARATATCRATCRATRTPALTRRPWRLAVISDDTTFDSLIVEADQTTRVENGATIEVLGDLVVEGTIEAVDGPLRIMVMGDLDVRGTLAAVHSGPPADDPSRPFFSQPSGLYLVVSGSFTFESTSRLETNGNLVITDEVDEMDLTPASVSAEARTNEGDLPTLVLLPPDHPDFDSSVDDAKDATKRLGARDRNRFAGTIDLQGAGDAEGRVLTIRTSRAATSVRGLQRSRRPDRLPDRHCAAVPIERRRLHRGLLRSRRRE